MSSDIQTRVVTRLPGHLILEHILPRLPVRNLFRLKSVCKHWYYIISSLYFVKCHLKFSSSRPNRFLLLANDSERYNYLFYLLSYNELRSNLEQIVLPLNFVNGLYGTIDIVGCCDGLVCLYHELNQRRIFYIWNPITRECREIDQIDEVEEIEPFMFTAAYGFGYGSSIDDYKIVAIFTSYSNDFISHSYVYSLKSGEWKRSACALDDYRVSTIGIHKGVSIDNKIYWPLRFRDQGEQVNFVVGFNLDNEQFEAKSWMSWLHQESETNLPLFTIQGCLSLCRYTNDNNTCFDIWMLKDRNDWNSWEKLCSANLGCVDFIHFSKDGRCLVHHLKQLNVLDLGQEDTKRIQRDNDLGGHYNGHIWEVVDYFDSFVSPFSG